MTRACEHCGTSFTVTLDGRSQRRRFCGENCRKRACDHRHRANCIDCGTERGPRSGFANGSGWPNLRCDDCENKRRARIVDERAQHIVRWWAEGLTLTEIATKLGWSLGHIRQEFDRLRTKGYDLPYRYTTGKRAGRKFPEQVAA